MDEEDRKEVEAIKTFAFILLLNSLFGIFILGRTLGALLS